jgi:hypothetical protein
MKTEKPGATVPQTAIYWCTVCKLPERFTAGEKFPACRNMCGKGYWELVEEQPEKRA